MPRFPFTQVDVFSDTGVLGNALAVVHDADDLDEAGMAAFARWTNLSETTFLLRPTDPEADYRVRIFTTTGELPFAGHPTLGSAHAWLEAGGEARHTDRVVQECAAGLVPVRRHEQLAFAAPPLRRSGPLDPDRMREVGVALGLAPYDVIDMSWIDNGPGWIGVELHSAQAVLDVEIDPVLGRDLQVGVIGRWPDAASVGRDVEVRGFYGDGTAVLEDPVTGSLNAGLGQWLIAAGRLPDRYVAGQGRAIGRDGVVHVEQIEGQVWVGGRTTTTIRGEVTLP